MDSKVRMNVTFGPKIYKILEDLASKDSRTKASVIRDALEFKKYVEDAQQDGSRLLLERRNGKLFELVLIR